MVYSLAASLCDLLERLRFCWRTAPGFFSPRQRSQSVLSSLCEQLLWTPWWEKPRLKKNDNKSSDSQLLCLKVEFYFESPLCSKLSHMFCRPMRWAVMLPRAKQYETNRQTYFQNIKHDIFFFKEGKFSSCETRWKKCWKRERKQSRGSKIPTNRFFRETFREFRKFFFSPK